MAPDRAPEAVERHLAIVSARWAALLTVPALVGGWVAAQGRGVLGALIAAAMVVVMRFASAGVLAWAARRGGGMLIVGAYGGFLGRLVVYSVVFSVLTAVPAVHVPTLAIATILLVVGTLLAEAVHLHSTPQLSWITTPTSLESKGTGA